MGRQVEADGIVFALQALGARPILAVPQQNLGLATLLSIAE